jgi:hypothetical protein
MMSLCGAKLCGNTLMPLIIRCPCADCLLAPCCPVFACLLASSSSAAVCRALMMTLCGAKWCGNTSTTATLMWHSRQLRPWQMVPMRSAVLTAAVAAHHVFELTMHACKRHTEQQR